MTLTKLLFSMLALSFLSGCAVMSKSDCLSADWQTVGYDVGLDGQRDARRAFNRRAEVCASHGVRAEWESFQVGHEQGIQRFCSVENAVIVGSKGRYGVIESEVCPEQDYPGFTEAFADGTRLYQLTAQVQHAELDLNRLHSELYRIQHRRAELKRQVYSGELSESEEARAIYRRKHLRRELYSVRQEIHACRERVAVYRSRAHSYAELIEIEYGHLPY